MFYLILKARTECLVHVAPDRELIVRKGRRLPDYRNLTVLDFPGLLFCLVYSIVHRAKLIGSRLDELKRARVIAREADAAENFIGAFAQVLPDVIFRHDAA